MTPSQVELISYSHKFLSDNMPVVPRIRKLRRKKTGGSHYYFCMPQKVYEALPDLEAMAAGEIPGFNKSYLFEILTIISLNCQHDKTEAPLKAAYLKKIIPGYQNYIKFLCTLGIIQKNDRYIPGKISFVYGFTQDYYSRYKYFLVSDQYLIRRLKRNHLRRNVTRKYKDQNHYIRSMTIEPEALNAIQNLPTKKYNYSLSAILKIQHRDIFYHVDSTSHRYHSNITNLPSDLVQYIRIQGKELAGIDIANSQLYFFTLLLTEPHKAAKYAKDKIFSMLLKSLKYIDSLDVKMYVFLAISGQLYEFLWDKFREQGLVFMDRKAVKKQVFVILFGSLCYWSKAHEVFERWFPSVYERICILKGKDFKRLAILLQTVESDLVLNKILTRIYSEHSGTIAVTKHDSVMTSILTNDIDSVSLIMNEVLSEFIGKPPKMKIDKKTTFFNQNIDKQRVIGREYIGNKVIPL